MTIKFVGDANNLSLKDNTAYEGEEEVLLQDGVNYIVEKVYDTTIEDNSEYSGRKLKMIELRNVSRRFDDLSCFQRLKATFY